VIAVVRADDLDPVHARSAVQGGLPAPSFRSPLDGLAKRLDAPCLAGDVYRASGTATHAASESRILPTMRTETLPRLHGSRTGGVPHLARGIAAAVPTA
jgi:hypothetical protein